MKNYFKIIDNAVEKLAVFLETLKQDNLFRSEIKKHPKVELLKYHDPKDIYSHIFVLFFGDVMRCYLELGCPVDLNSKEGFGLWLLLVRTYPFSAPEYSSFFGDIRTFRDIVHNSNDSNMNDSQIFSSLKEDYSISYNLKELDYIINVEYFAKNDLESKNVTSEDKFVISRILKKYDTDLQKQYLVLLYRFASIIAKADGVISETEEKWLSELLKLSEEKTQETSSEEDECFDELLESSEEKPQKTSSEEDEDEDECLDELFELSDEKIQEIISNAEKWLSELLKLSEEKPQETSSEEEECLDELLESSEEKSQESISTEGKNVQKVSNDVSTISPIEKLQTLVGLETVKTEISTLVNFIKIQQVRQEKGLKCSQLSYHCVFTGSPGTGKTTVARIVAEIYKELGILKKGHLVETDRSGLIAEYVGQTAIKTNKMIESALDGVLFIDEAYSLVSASENDYGKESIATLLKRMEDDRDRFIVILAGYTTEMQDFINSNPGLKSRFNRYIDFPDYSADELYQIFELNLKKFDYTIAQNAADHLKQYFSKTVEDKDRNCDKNFGNARFVRNFFEKTIERQANRLAHETNLTTEKLSEICVEDIL
jgi:SpoVK/Ycf46/Vps4 family AAA+-type ATPase